MEALLYLWGDEIMQIYVVVVTSLGDKKCLFHDFWMSKESICVCDVYSGAYGHPLVTSESESIIFSPRF